jgi:hypothetical protein
MHHSDCIIDWLNRKCTCPTCRYEVPSSDPNFEREKLRKGLQRQRPSGRGEDDDDDDVGGPMVMATIQAQRQDDHEWTIFRQHENFDLILRRTLRMKKELEEAKRKQQEGRNGLDEVAATEDIPSSDDYVGICDRGEFRELYAGIIQH